MYKKILVPTDGSTTSELAIAESLELAKKLDAEITILHVIPNVPPLLVTPHTGLSPETFDPVVAEMEKNSTTILEEVKRKFGDSGVKFNTKILKGDPAYVISNEAKENGYDLIMMANRGLGEIKQYLMGSVSNRVVKHAECSVLIFK